MQDNVVQEANIIFIKMTLLKIGKKAIFSQNV